jgi:glycosyltransferase involved in cell wall biosynthesis
MAGCRVSVVVPVYNEEDNAGILYDQIRSSLDPLGAPYEILFVDDGSSDGTLTRLKNIHRRERNEEGLRVTTRILRLARNFGQTAATQAGFDHARGDVVVSMDGDLQNDPEDIPLLLAKLEEGYDVVCGWRKQRHDKALTRVLPSKVANWLIGRITGVRIHDSGCSLKAYRSSVIRSIRLYSDMHRFIPPMCSMVGARIAEVVVHHRPREHGRTKYGMARIWKVLFDIVTVKMLIHFHHRPISFFSIPAFFSFLAGGLLGAAAIVLSLLGGQTIVFSGGCFLMFFLAASLISWGLIAEFFVMVEERKRQGPRGPRERAGFSSGAGDPEDGCDAARLAEAHRG